jgi:hypothetical protein
LNIQTYIYTYKQTNRHTFAFIYKKKKKIFMTCVVTTVATVMLLQILGLTG